MHQDDDFHTRKKRWDDHYWHTVPQPQGWSDQAACKGYPLDWWFAPTRAAHERRRAKEICMTCPVRQECADYANSHDWITGIWGGIERAARKRSRQERGAMSAESAALIALVLTLGFVLFKLWTEDPVLFVVASLVSTITSLIWYLGLVRLLQQDIKNTEDQLRQAREDAMTYWEMLSHQQRKALYAARRQPTF